MNKQVTLYKPFPWQKAVHHAITDDGFNSGHIYVVKAKRQIGKTYIIINELLRFALTKNRSTNANLSPTLSQSRKVYRDIVKCLDGTGLIAKHNDSLLEVTLINDSLIMFKSAEQRENLRGFTITGILTIDEAAYIMDDIYYNIKATTDVHKAPILMVSTPRLKSGFFYAQYMLGMDGSYPLISAFDLTEYDTSALLSREMLEMYRKMIPKNQFTTEYLGQFLDTESITFGDFRSCIGTPEYRGGKIYWGIDWSSGVGGDDTCIVGIDERGNEVILDYFNTCNLNETIDRIASHIRSHPCGAILAERNSIGNPMIQLLEQRLGHGYYVTDFITSNTSKSELVKMLQVGLENKSITLKDDKKQTQELSVYEASYNPKTNVVTFNAPLGLHDDICMALMFAYRCLKDNTDFKNYVIR